MSISDSIYRKRNAFHLVPFVFFIFCNMFHFLLLSVDIVAFYHRRRGVDGTHIPPNFAWAKAGGNLGILGGASRDFTRF